MRVTSHFCDNHRSGYCRDAGGSHLSRGPGNWSQDHLHHAANQRPALTSTDQWGAAASPSEYREEDKLENVPSYLAGQRWHSGVTEWCQVWTNQIAILGEILTNKRPGRCDMWHVTLQYVTHTKSYQAQYSLCRWHSIKVTSRKFKARKMKIVLIPIS